MGGAGGSPGPICGDGLIEAPETCDDKNIMDGDGCSAECLTEPGPTCPGFSVVLTPAGAALTGTLSSQGDDIDPSCGPDTLKDAAYAVTPTVSGTMTATFVIDGNKSLSIRSSCPGSLQGSEITCASGPADQVQSMFVHAGQTYIVVVDAQDSGNYSLKLELTTCGDGVVDNLEQCDSPLDMACLGCVLCNGAGEFWSPASKHCYRLVSAVQTFSAARADCVKWGGDLAGISSAAEFDFLAGHMNPTIAEDTWVGGVAVTPLCTYAWVNGETWRSEWADNEPQDANDRCLQMWFSQGKKIDDTDCSYTHAYLCERTPAGKCGDAILQPGEACDDGNNNGGDGCDADCKPDKPCSALPNSVEGGAPKHCYFRPGNNLGWNDAKNACTAEGGYLVTIESAAENDIVKGMLPGETWIGAWEGGMNNGSLMWEAPSTNCGYKNFDPGSGLDGNEDCMRMMPNGTWRDAGCGIAFPYICERDY